MSILPGFVWENIQNYNASHAANWRFANLAPPIAPIVKSVVDTGNSGVLERLGYAHGVSVDLRSDGIRIGANKHIELAWPRCDVRFWQFLNYHYVFAIPMDVECPIFTPVDPEICYTPDDNDDLFLVVYYGKERRWKSGSVTVYLNDVVQSSGFTLNHINGSITFDSALERTDVVTVLYTYQAKYLIVGCNPNFVSGFGITTVAPDIAMEEIAG